MHTLGTPSEENWPELTKLPDYNKITFAISKGVDLGSLIHTSSNEAKNLIKLLVQYDPNKRPTSKMVLQQLYHFLF